MRYNNSTVNYKNKYFNPSRLFPFGSGIVLGLACRFVETVDSMKVIGLGVLCRLCTATGPAYDSVVLSLM